MINKLNAQSEFNEDEFYRAFAIAMLKWQAVEHNLFILFHSLVVPEQLRSSGAIYYSLNSFGAKLNIVDKVAAVILNKEKLKQWNTLKKRLTTASGDRNVLAHLTATVDFKNGSLVLVDPVFLPAQIGKKRNKKYDVTGLIAIADTFSQLGMDIEVFTDEIGRQAF